jgi:hypothetical protein
MRGSDLEQVAHGSQLALMARLRMFKAVPHLYSPQLPKALIAFQSPRHIIEGME